MANRRVLDLLDAALVALEADGVAIGAAVGEEVQFVCRGSRAGERVDPQTIFYAASVTKQIVGVLLARAIIDRAADINDPVLRWLRNFPIGPDRSAWATSSTTPQGFPTSQPPRSASPGATRM